MRISLEAHRELRDKLPPGSAQKIKTRLAKKNKRYTDQYIYRCLDPDHEDYNHFIIDEAILVCENAACRKAAREKRINLIIKTK